MENKTMTSREFYNAIISGAVTEQVVNYAKGQVKKLDEKNERRRTTTSKNQQENIELCEKIMQTLEKGRYYLASEVVAAVEGLKSTQKASALLAMLAEEGKIIKEDVKVKGAGKKKGYCIPNE